MFCFSIDTPGRLKNMAGLEGLPQELGAFTSLAEDPGWVPSIHLVANNHM